MPQRVFVDANVLYSKTLMDWLFLLRIENEGMFQVYSTEDVLAEVLASMRKHQPNAPGHLTRRRAELMRECLDEVLADFPGHGDLPRPFTGSDAHDFHVHAAAVAGRADVILTADREVDITAEPDQESYEVMHPDDFFLLVVDSNPRCLATVAREQLRYWQDRPSHCQLDDALHRARCPQFAGRVRTALRQIALKP